MNRRPGHVDVTTEVGYCNFCQRPRNLRTEAHHLGTLVRTIVTCETCHRTLSSSIGVATAEPVTAEPEPVPEPRPEPAATEPKSTKPAHAAKPAAKRVTAAKKPAAVKKKPAPRGGKPTSTATRKVTKKK
jgi:hypothetical protein